MGKQLTSGIWQAPPDQFEMPVGMPRPLYDGKPVPYTALIGSDISVDGLLTVSPDFADVDWDRMHKCWDEIRCLVCGDSVPETAALIAVALDGKDIDWSGYEPGDDLDVEVREGGAFCVRCAKLAMAHCPALRKPGAGTIMVGPSRDIRVDDGHEKIRDCPRSFRPLTLVRARQGREAKEPVLL